MESSGDDSPIMKDEPVKPIPEKPRSKNIELPIGNKIIHGKFSLQCKPRTSNNLIRKRKAAESKFKQQFIP